MSEIKAGDLVMIVKPTLCCGNAGSLGQMFIVDDRPLPQKSKCYFCGSVEPITKEIVPLSSKNVCARSRLKKIDPPAEGDDLPTRRDLHNNIRRESHAQAVNGA